MAKKQSTYVSKEPDERGLRHYSEDEGQIWADLYDRQLKFLPNRACSEFMDCLHELGLPHDRVPQLPEVNQTLAKATGWGVEGVPALISFEKFFKLLADKKFPAATFIRNRDEFEYLQEPDIFHEIFGHCPLLMNPVYADFMQRYGEMGLEVDKADRAMLARLYWFTIEFGLIRHEGEKLEIYGAGIVSSVGESKYALSSPEEGGPELRPINLVDVFRTLYRIDIYQPIYYVIESFEQLYALVEDKGKVFEAIAEAKRLGPFKPTFAVDDLPENDLRRKMAG